MKGVREGGRRERERIEITVHFATFVSFPTKHKTRPKFLTALVFGVDIIKGEFRKLQRQSLVSICLVLSRNNGSLWRIELSLDADNDAAGLWNWITEKNNQPI